MTATDADWPNELDIEDDDDEDNATIKLMSYDSTLTADATPLVSNMTTPPSSRPDVTKGVLPDVVYTPPIAPLYRNTIEQVNLTVEASTQNAMHIVGKSWRFRKILKNAPALAI